MHHCLTQTTVIRSLVADTNLVEQIDDSLTNVGMDITAGWDVEQGDFKVDGGLLKTRTTFTYYTVSDTFLLNAAAEKSYYTSDEDELEHLSAEESAKDRALVALQSGLNYSIDVALVSAFRYTPTDIECADGAHAEFHRC